ncbi:hypothetical protein Syun_028081 [Stephania yunnanensis]|uniref:Uncharacterized protein n=1 Tax=Stephania yunnanensis TaxID=152371 RepID=A0AAP0EJ74_9MAGN
MAAQTPIFSAEFERFPTAFIPPRGVLSLVHRVIITVYSNQKPPRVTITHSNSVISAVSSNQRTTHQLPVGKQPMRF